jgi:hypothetical protein
MDHCSCRCIFVHTGAAVLVAILLEECRPAVPACGFPGQLHAAYVSCTCLTLCFVLLYAGRRQPWILVRPVLALSIIVGCRKLYMCSTVLGS